MGQYQLPRKWRASWPGHSVHQFLRRRETVKEVFIANGRLRTDVALDCVYISSLRDERARYEGVRTEPRACKK